MQQADPNFWPTLYALAEESSTVSPARLAELSQALQSEHGAIRYWTVVSLGRMQPMQDATFALLQSAREDRTPEVRVAAAEALLKHGADERAQLELLATLLKDDDMWVRVAAATSLDNAGGGAAGYRCAPDGAPGSVQQVRRARRESCRERVARNEQRSAIAALRHRPTLSQSLGHYGVVASAIRGAGNETRLVSSSGRRGRPQQKILDRVTC